MTIIITDDSIVIPSKPAAIPHLRERIIQSTGLTQKALSKSEACSRIVTKHWETVSAVCPTFHSVGLSFNFKAINKYISPCQ